MDYGIPSMDEFLQEWEPGRLTVQIAKHANDVSSVEEWLKEFLQKSHNASTSIHFVTMNRTYPAVLSDRFNPYVEDEL